MRQRSSEWHEWRRSLIGASEIAAVLGLSPWLTARELWEIKTGRREPQQMNAAMRRGTELEAAARFAVEAELGLSLSDPVLRHPELPLGASLDGYAEGTVVEIKCPGIQSYERMRGGIPDYYMAQLQQQALVAAANGMAVERMVLYVWHPELGGYMHETHPSEEWAERIAAAAVEFWHRVQADEWPEDELASLVEALAAAKAAEAEAVEARKRLEAELAEAMAARGAKRVETLAGLRATLVRRKTIDRKAAEADEQWQALKAQEREIKERLREIEARYQVLGAPYIRLGGGR